MSTEKEDEFPTVTPLTCQEKLGDVPALVVLAVKVNKSFLQKEFLPRDGAANVVFS